MPQDRRKKRVREGVETDENKKPTTLHPAEVVLLIGGVVLVLFLGHTVEAIISPFVVVGAVLFLLFPLRRLPLARTVMWLGILLFTLWFVYSLGTILFPFVIAFLIAYLMNPVIERLQERRVPRWLSALVVILLFLGLGVVVLMFVMPLAISQFQGILEGISGIVNDVMVIVQGGNLFMTLEDYGFPVDRLQKLIDEKLTPRLETILKGLLEGTLNVISSISALVTHIVNAIIIPFLAFYMMKDFPIIMNRFKMLIPKGRREEIADYSRKVDALFGRYLRGAFMVALIHGVLVSFFLWLFGIRFALVLGMVAGVLSLIPYFGLFTSLALSILVALFSGDPVWTKVVFVLVTFGFLQILEFSVLSPNILGRQIGLHPVLLILSLLVFGFFIGFIGLLIAVPTTAILIMMVKEWEERRKARQTHLM